MNAITKLLALHANVKCRKQEVGDNLGVCFLKFLPEINIQSNLIIINLVKVVIYFLTFFTRSHVTTLGVM